MEPIPAPVTPLGARTPHTHPGLYAIIGVLSLVVLFGTYWVFATYDVFPDRPTATTAPTPASAAEYHNAELGLSISLPNDWAGFRVISDEGAGAAWHAIDVATGAPADNGLVVVLRHPLWTQEKPYEDLPVMVFSHAQWEHIRGPTNVEWSVGAAPIPPSPLASNSRYVFALPARYNFDLSEGFQELDDAVRAGAVRAF